MSWLRISSCLGLLLLLASPSRAAVSCDPSKENQGCSAFGRCEVTTLTCRCNAGFSGDGVTCNSACTAVNTTCDVDASSCVDLPQTSTSYGCLCNHGYQWSPGGSKCIDVDECSERKCSPFSTCNNTNGDYSCQCCYSSEGFEGISGFGYIGDGKTKCYADSILFYGGSDRSFVLTKEGYLRTVVPGGYPYFGQLYWDIFFHTDGLITFDYPEAPYLGGDAFPTRRQIKFIAPFWTDMAVSSEPGSGLYVDEYSLYGVSGRLKTGPGSIDSFPTKLRSWIDEINLPGFVPSQIVVATWANMTAKPASSFPTTSHSRITFQVVMVTNGTHSFGFTSYAENPKDTEWDLPMDNVYIGFSGEDFSTRQPVDFIGQLFQDAPSSASVCQQMSFLTQRGRLYRVFGPPFTPNTNPACLAEASKQWNEHKGFGIDSEDDEGSSLPPELYCPCFEQQAYSDNRFVVRNVEAPHPDRRSCHMSRFYRRATYGDKTFLARAYCCYDSLGALVTSGPGAGGIVPQGYEMQMVTLKAKCCADADLCDVFSSIYRPINCHRYTRPRVAYIRGGGHFNGLTNQEYTFDGRGEYNYFSYRATGSIEVQVRMSNRTYENDKKTSFVTAIVVRCNVAPNIDEVVFEPRKAEIRVNSTGQLELLVDGVHTPIGELPDEFNTTFPVGCDSQYCEVACKYQMNIFSWQIRLTNFYLRLNTTMPGTDDNTPFGLVGDIDGRLMYVDENGDQVEVTDLNDDAQLQKFGESWRIKEIDSLFTYDNSDSWTTYNEGDYMPTYWSEIKPTIDIDNMDAICHCGGDHACQYDQLVTDDLAISTATHEAQKDIINDRAALATRTPQWDAEPNLLLSVHEDFVGNFANYVKYDEFFELDVSEDGSKRNTRKPIVVDEYDVSTNLDTDLYTLDSKTGAFSIMMKKSPDSWRFNSYSVMIYAIKYGQDGAVARSRYSPNVFVCACQMEEQCDYSYAANRSSLERSTSFDNYYLLPCDCPANSTDRFCLTPLDPCTNNPCDKHAQCEVDFSSASGYQCTCNSGYTGNGLICTLNECPANHGCDQHCYLDSETAQPTCSCDAGYALVGDKTCEDRNECNSPWACPDAKDICVNTKGGYYCTCEAGYKPMKGNQRWGCLSASNTYLGTITFEHYWDFKMKTWQGWSATLGMPESTAFASVARQLETMIGDLIKLVEPMSPSVDLYTYVYHFSQESGNRIKLSYKIYPPAKMDAAMILSSLKSYFTQRAGEAAGLKGIVSASATFTALTVNNYCESSCASPFATCQNSDSEKVCRCNPGFVSDNLDNCNSYCYTRQCSPTSSHSCRDLAQIGPECLCKKGYTLDAFNTCQKTSACPTDSNPCGSHGICNDLGDGTYSCSCDEGYVKAANPMPDICVPDVMFCRNEATSYPDSVYVTGYESYYKVAIPVGFPYFDSKQWKLYIGPNGIITFGKNVTASELRSFHPSTYGYVIAPLWSDYVWDRSKIKFNIYDSTTSAMTPQWQMIIEQIRNATRVAQATYPAFTMAGYPRLEEPTRFDPKTVVIVTWTDLQLRPYPNVDKVSMQAVIASDGAATVVIWNYDTASMSVKSWDDPSTTQDSARTYSHRGFVGFQGGSRQFCLNRVNFGESHTDCRNFSPNQLIQSKGPLALYPGRHVFLVANDVAVQTSGDRDCFDILKEYDESDEIIDLNYIHSALDDDLPDPCPWTETQVLLDGRFQKLFGPRDKSCYVKRFSSAFPYDTADGETKTANIRPYCCYKSNALLMDSSSTTHMVVDEHTLLQSRIQTKCCLQTAHCILANYYVPAVYVDGYEPPVTAAVYGDPHMITFDGMSVTFKGRGDYVLFNSSKLSLHGRFGAMGDPSTANGSALVATAWHVSGYPKVVTDIDSEGKLRMTYDGVAVDLTLYERPFSWKADGDIKSILSREDSSIVEQVDITYADGLKFEVYRKKSEHDATYLHLTIRMPKTYGREPNSGLLSDFIFPDGTPYQPKFYGTLFMGDNHYFYNYGRNWTVSQAMVPSLFPTPAVDDEYVPLFYETEIINYIDSPKDTPTLEMCYRQMPCAYDYVVTGDMTVARETLLSLDYVQRRRRYENEKPPTFRFSNPYVWLINTRSYYITFTPELEDPSPDVTFSVETDFPENLYKIDPLSGTIVVIMTEEARDTLLNKGPFSFYIIAKRGESGAAAYKPVAVRICNCNDERSCDYSDDRDGIFVGIIPTENAQRYTIARCNCYGFQTGKFCDQLYDACQTSPCYPSTPCFPLRISDLRKESFSCGSCPAPLKGDGFHCLVNNPCSGYTCSDDKVCANVNGYARCVCPEGTTTLSDGSCQYQDACALGNVCSGDGQRCNSAPQGKYFCDCKPGYAPRYVSDSTLLDLNSCERITYTYVGSVTFSHYYNATTKALETFSPSYRRPDTVEYQTFARRVLFDLQNAAGLVKSSITAVYIRDVRPVVDDGFVVDWFAYANTALDTASVETTMGRYYNQINKAGVIVNIFSPRANSTFISICDSMHSPCRAISDISTCTQRGIPGEGATCQCRSDYGWETGRLSTGDYFCRDVCDDQCKAADSKSKCQRSSRTTYTCPCLDNHVLNSTSKKCEAIPPVCTPGKCGDNAYCVVVDSSNHVCLCYTGYQQDTATGLCISNCQAAGSCKGVANSYGCQNLANGYQCLCNGGYRWTGSACDDVDECAPGSSVCSRFADCINTVGSYNCRCKTGYEPADASHSVCYATKSNVLYPYNFDKVAPIRDTDYTASFLIRGGFTYWDNFFHHAIVGFDGFVGLDQAPPNKYFGQVLSTHIVAPFWMDLDVHPSDSSSGLYIDAFDAYYNSDNVEQWRPVFDLANEHLQTQYPFSDNPNLLANDTIPTAMLVITWVKVTPAPASAYSNYYTTFQAILGANSGFSFAIFNYLESSAETNWPTAKVAPELQPRIGYTIGIEEIRLVPFNNDPPNFWEVFETHFDSRQIRGRIVQAFGFPVEIETRTCLVEFVDYPLEIIEVLYGLNRPESGLARHTACPAFLKQMELDARWQPEIAIDDAICYGGSFWNTGYDMVFTNKTYAVRSFCCYDWESGAFLDGLRGHVNSFLQIKEFRSEMERLFNPCCRNSPYCELYSYVNPAGIISPEYYDQPVIAYIRGDPHIGMPLHKTDTEVRQMTFNGLGEFTLLKSDGVAGDFGKINVQVRFGLRSDVTKQATFVTGIAFQAAGADKIEVTHHNGDIYLFKNGEQIDMNTIILPLTHDVVEESSYDLWASKDFIGYVTGYGLSFHIYEVESSYFNIRISLPPTLSNHVTNLACGLLTSFESAPFVDCDNNTAAGDVMGSELDAYNFGLQFKLKDKSESLFSYKVGPSFDQANTAPLLGWRPVFPSDLLGLPSDADQVCGEDQACKYDYGVTLNSKIASDTRSFGEQLLMAQGYAAMVRPEIYNFEIVKLELSDIGKTFEVDAESFDEGTDGFHYALHTNLPMGHYSFNETTGFFSVVATRQLLEAVRENREAPYLRFVASKGAATDLWAPTVFTNACEQKSQAYDSSEDNYAEREKNYRHNYFLPCVCPAAFRGKYCQFDFDPCEETPNPCSDASICRRDVTSKTGFTCGTCPVGFVSVDGYCKPKICPAGTCSNGDCEVSLTDGSFVCKCWSGYEISPYNSHVCRDINECSIGTHDCFKYGSGYECTNTPGNFTCGCRYGYYPDDVSNFHACEKAKHQVVATLRVMTVLIGTEQVGWSEELNNPSSERYILVAAEMQKNLLYWFLNDLHRVVKSIVINKLTQGSIEADYTVNSDEDIDANQLAADQKAFIENGGTIGGLAGADASSISVATDTCSTDPKCDLMTTSCRWDDTASAQRCDCLKGFVEIPVSDTTCRDNCTAICAGELGANSMCTRSGSEYTCGCTAGFVPSGGQCLGNCATNVCNNGGTCAVTATGAIVCQCPDNYGGNRCQYKCDCSGNGFCADDEKPICTCNAGYTGVYCESCSDGYEKVDGKCVSKCVTQNPCKNGGTCIISGSEPKCICQIMHAGLFCEAERDLSGDTASDTNLIIVSAVLGSVCFILLCVILGFFCLVQKNKKSQKGSKPASNTYEMSSKQKKRSSSSSSSSSGDVPQIEIRAPARYESAYGAAPPSQPVYPPKAVPTQPQPVAVPQVYGVTNEPEIRVQTAPQPVLASAAPPATYLAPPAPLPSYQKPSIYAEVDESADF